MTFSLLITMWFPTLVLAAILRSTAGDAPWWSTSVYYRILVDSFRDSDGDGLGDLNGATKQISYVLALGADAVILSPLSTKSPDCSKPGTLDFIEIDHRYGNVDNFLGLLEKAKKLELKVVVTLSLQTVSSSSEWFNSSASRTPGFEDTILWQDGTLGEPPQSKDGVDWVWHDTRNAYWASRNNEAVLNLCSDTATTALSAAQCAWLRRGVSGVLLNPDFPRDTSCGEQLLKRMAAEALSCARSANLDVPVVLVESLLPPEIAAKYYADGSVGANSVLSRALTDASRKSTPELGTAFYAAILNAPQDLAPTWLTSSQNESRIATRYGSEMVDAINLLSLILPGAVIIQQGDELGTADTILEWATSSKCWPSPPAPFAAPFPWAETANGGFTTGDPWLPLAPNYRYANAKTEFANDFSHVGVMKVAAAMRKSPAIGPHVEIKRLGEAIAVLRWGGTGSLLVVSNVGRHQTEVNLSRIAGLPNEMTVAASSSGSSLAVGSHVNVEKILKLVTGETVLLAGPHRHCGGPGPVDKIANKLNEGWQKLNKYFGN